jgi:hypothetical protein
LHSTNQGITLPLVCGVAGLMRSFLLAVVLSLVFLSCVSPARADDVSVEFTAINLGSGTWQYDYTLQGSFLANWGVAIYFPTPSYGGGSVTDLGTGGSDWLTFALQADPTIPAPGEYDIVALVDNPSRSSIFDVTFQWNGTGTPGTQAFNLYDFTSGAELLASGTTAVVPEPTTLMLMLFAGLAYLAGLMIRRFV